MKRIALLGYMRGAKLGGVMVMTKESDAVRILLSGFLTRANTSRISLPLFIAHLGETDKSFGSP